MNDNTGIPGNLYLKQFAIDHAVDGIYWIDGQSRILEVNKGACRMTGYSREELMSMSVGDLNPEYPLERFGQFWNHIKQVGSEALESIHRHKDGHLIDVEITANFIRYEGKELICSFVHDITTRKRDQRLMEMMKFSMDHMADKVTWVTQDAKVVYANLAACSSLEYTMDEMLAMSIPDFDPDFPAEVWPSHWNDLRKYGSHTFETRHRTKSGRIYPVEVSINYMRFGDEEYNCGFARDITRRKQLEEDLKLASLVLQNSSEGMLITDENNLIVAANPAFTSITGYTLEEVKGKNPRIFKSGHHDEAFYRAMWDEIKSTGHWQGEIWDRRKDGLVRAKWMTINTIRNQDDSVHRYMALFSDITERKETEQVIWRQANFDSLTGLPNRDMFRDRLNQEIKKSDRDKSQLALLLIDLDQFKGVNDALGHAAGDALLVEAGNRISGCVRESDTVSRLGGDEFTVVIPDMSSSTHIEDVAQKIIERLAEPFHLDNEVVYVSASIGITLYPKDATEIDTLMKNADQAMYVAKDKGRNRFSYFTQSLQEAAQNRLHLISDLRSALREGQIKLYFQPVMELSTGRIVKAEALVRWQHPARGLISPEEFIPLAEDIGLIHELGDWVFRESLKWAAIWNKDATTRCQLSVNMSPVQFQKGRGFYQEWCESLVKHGLTGKDIVLEITEGVLLDAEPEVVECLYKFRDAGIQVAIDDFGTGYSSLAYLKKFDIDYLKIDRSFISNLESDADDRVLSEAVIVMAHKLGLKVVAEGVETQAQKEFLQSAGCDFAQGFLLSEPIAPEALGQFLHRS